MKSFPRSESLLIFLYFALLLFLVSQFWPSVSLKNFNLDLWTSTASEAQKAFGDGDSGSYISYGKVLLTDLSFKMDYWFVRLWPPLFPMVIAAVIGFTGEDQYLLKMTIVSILVWSSVFLFFIKHLFSGKKQIGIIIFSLLLLLPEFRGVILGSSVFYAESLSTAFFFLGCLSIWLFCLKKTSFYFYTSVLGVAVAANMKALIEGTLTLSIFTLCGLLISYELNNYLRTRQDGDFFGFVKSLFLKYSALIKFVLILKASTFPWKLYNYLNYGAFSFSTDGLRLIWKYHWTMPSDLPDFVHAGNTACLMDIDFCKYVSANYESMSGQLSVLTFKQMASYPLDWIAYRASQFSWFWFNGPWLPFDGWTAYEQSLRIEALGYFVFLAFGIYQVAKTELSAKKISGAALVSFMIANAFLFSFIHFESRYSLTIRLTFLLVGLIGISIATGNSRKNPIF